MDALQMALALRLVQLHRFVCHYDASTTYLALVLVSQFRRLELVGTRRIAAGTGNQRGLAMAQFYHFARGRLGCPYPGT